MDVTVAELAIESFYPAEPQTAEALRVTPDRLSLRALNRASLHRQLLLDRAPMTARKAVGHLARPAGPGPAGPVRRAVDEAGRLPS